MGFSGKEFGRWVGIVVSGVAGLWIVLSIAIRVFGDGGVAWSYNFIEMGYALLFALPLFCVAWLCWKRHYGRILIVAAAVAAVVLGVLVQSVLVAYQVPALVAWIAPWS